jgi:hypothetical protein
VAYGLKINGNPVVFLANDTWTIVNGTSGSVGTIKFHQITKQLDSETSMSIDTFVRILNGKHLTGAYNELKGQDGCWKGNCELILCYNQQYVPLSLPTFPGCAMLNNTIITPNHLEFVDQHGGTIAGMKI